MKLSSLIEAIWLVTGGYLFYDGLDGLLSPAQPGGMFSSRISFALAIYCLLYWAILRLSKQLLHRIMLIVGLALFIGYPLRVLILTLDPTRLAFNVGRSSFTEHEVMRTVLYVAIGSVALWVGAGLALRTVRNRNATPIHMPQADFFLAHRRPLIAASLFCSALTAALPTFNLLARSQSQSTEFSILSQVLPVQILLFIVMGVVIRYWSHLTTAERAGAIASFTFAFMADFVGGRRGSLFGIVFIYLIVSLWLDPDRTIALPRLVFTGIAFLVVLPSLFSATLSFRNSVDRGGTVWDAVLNRDTSETFTVRDIGEFVTDRLGNFDATLIAMNYRPPGLSDEMSGTGVVRSLLLRLTPDAVYAPDQLSLGRLWGIHYDGVPREIRHAGAWSGFGLAFGFFGWWGIVAASLWAFAIAKILAYCNHTSPFNGAVSAYACSSLLVVMIRSGNVDDVAGQAISQLVGLAVVLFALRAPRRSRTASRSVPSFSAIME